MKYMIDKICLIIMYGISIGWAPAHVRRIKVLINILIDGLVYKKDGENFVVPDIINQVLRVYHDDVAHCV